jgi:MORN repeat variant
MNLKECEALLAAAIAKSACKGNADAARRYLDAGDVDGFERVCRGNYDWLRYKKIAYVLTNGAAENWHDNGRIGGQSNYVDGQMHGQCVWWHDNGRIGGQSNYVNGERHGECTWWNSDGRLLEQSNYVNGVKQP